MDLNLAGKTALVTGASRGIGASIAQELAREGVRVCLAARDRSRLDEVAGGIAAISGSNRTITIAGDLRQPAAVQAAVDAAVGAFGRLDILVNNAGATKRADFFTLTEEDWQDGFALKFHGYVRATAPRGRICANRVAASSTSLASVRARVQPSSPSAARSTSRS